MKYQVEIAEGEWVEAKKCAGARPGRPNPDCERCNGSGLVDGNTFEPDWQEAECECVIASRRENNLIAYEQYLRDHATPFNSGRSRARVRRH